MHVSGTVRWWLRVEGLVLFAVGVAAYAHLGLGWGWFAALFLVPDLAFVGYLAGPRVGAIAYNTMHSVSGPGALAILGAAGVIDGALPIAAIWIAHVGFDRALGYGLKYPSGFRDTHLGRIGRARPTRPAPAPAS